MSNKKIPPFSAPLNKLIQNGFHPNGTINVWIGNLAWQKGIAFSKSYPSRTITLPPWDNPIDFYWPVIACDVLIHDTGYAEDDYIEDLVLCLYRDKAAFVRMLTPDFTLIVYKKD